MNCQRAREFFPELLDSRTSGSTHAEARVHLAECPDCQREFAALSQTLNALDTMPASQPSPRLRQNFYAMLNEEKRAAGETETVPPKDQPVVPHRITVWRWLVPPLAGAALLAAGFVAGQRSVPPPAPAVAAAPNETAALRQELAQLQDQMTKMGTLVSFSLLQHQQRSANERLRGIFASTAEEAADEQTLNNLIQTLALDPNTNVRLGALDTLSAYADRELVRSGVRIWLPRETNPLVQLRMIDFLASAQDERARPTLEKLFADATADQNVRDAARRALAQL